MPGYHVSQGAQAQAWHTDVTCDDGEDHDEDDNDNDDDTEREEGMRDGDIFIFPVIGSLWTIGGSGVPFPFSSNQNEDNRTEFEGRKYQTFKVGGNPDAPPEIWETLFLRAAPPGVATTEQQIQLPTSLVRLEAVLQKVADQGAFHISLAATDRFCFSKLLMLFFLCRAFPQRTVLRSHVGLRLPRLVQYPELYGKHEQVHVD